MKTTINFSKFCNSFSESYKDNFTYEGKKALFEWLQELEEESGVEDELDTVALCCEFSEYSSLEEFQKEYNKEEYETLDDIEASTIVIYTGKYQDENAPFLIASF